MEYTPRINGKTLTPKKNSALSDFTLVYSKLNYSPATHDAYLKSIDAVRESALALKDSNNWAPNIKWFIEDLVFYLDCIRYSKKYQERIAAIVRNCRFIASQVSLENQSQLSKKQAADGLY